MSECDAISAYYREYDIYGDGYMLSNPCETYTDADKFQNYCQVPNTRAGTTGTNFVLACDSLENSTSGSNLYDAMLAGDFNAGFVELQQPRSIGQSSRAFVSSDSNTTTKNIMSAGNNGFYAVQNHRYQINSDQPQYIAVYNSDGVRVTVLQDQTVRNELALFNIQVTEDRYVWYIGDVTASPRVVKSYDVTTGDVANATNPLLINTDGPRLEAIKASADGTVWAGSGTTQQFDPPATIYWFHFSRNDGTPVYVDDTTLDQRGLVAVSSDGTYLALLAPGSAGIIIYNTTVAGGDVKQFTTSMTECSFQSGSNRLVCWRAGTDSFMEVVDDVSQATLSPRIVTPDGTPTTYTQWVGISGNPADPTWVAQTRLSSSSLTDTIQASYDDGATWNVIYSVTQPGFYRPATLCVSPFQNTIVCCGIYQVENKDVLPDDIYSLYDTRQKPFDESIKAAIADTSSAMSPVLLLANGVVVAGPKGDPGWDSRTSDTVTSDTQSYDAALAQQINIQQPDVGQSQWWTSPNVGEYALHFDGLFFKLYQNVTNSARYDEYFDTNPNLRDEAEETYADVYADEVDQTADPMTVCASNEVALASVYGDDLQTLNPLLYGQLLPIARCMQVTCSTLAASSEQSVVATMVRRINCPSQIVICNSNVELNESEVKEGFVIEQDCGPGGTIACTVSTDCDLGEECLESACWRGCTSSYSGCDCNVQTNLCNYTGSGGGGGGGGGGDDGFDWTSAGGIAAAVAIGVVCAGVLALIGCAAAEKLPGQANYDGDSKPEPEPEVE